MPLSRFAPSLALALLVACGDKDTVSSDTGAVVSVDDTSADDTAPAEIDADDDGYPEADDCDDTDDAIHPAAAEVCDGLDNDCDDAIDDDDPDVDPATQLTSYDDGDGDGYGDDADSALTCAIPDGHVEVAGDCDDTDAAVHPAATEICNGIDDDCDGDTDDADPDVDPSTQTTAYPDADGDGYGDAADPGAGYCVVPDGYITSATDCDDADVAVHPDAQEVCDPLDADEDCDGAADDADDSVDPSGQTTAYPDADGDSFGDDADPGALYCDVPSGYATRAGDCDDSDPNSSPDKAEICDDFGIDQDCDGAVDEAGALGEPTWYADADGDGYGDADDAGIVACHDASGRVSTGGDCDDAESAVNPGASEICDDADTDEDCDGWADDLDASVDASTQTLAYPDVDGDSYGDETSAGALYCDVPSGLVLEATDCDDRDDAVNPDATEICDRFDADEDCSGAADDDDPGVDASTQTTGYPDDDGDGQGAEAGELFCDLPSGYQTVGLDCDDADPLVYTGATALCDGIQNDCAASWTDDAGLATFFDAAGAPTDLTDTLDAGNAASPVSHALGDAGTLQLCAGSWYALLDLQADVSVVGLDGAGSTTLSGAEGGSVITVSADKISASLSDLTLTAGAGTDGISLGGASRYTAGGAVLCDGAASLALAGVAITDNAAERGAGILADADCALALSDVTFSGNEADVGGGLYLNGAIAECEGCSFDTNTADLGGGAYLDTAALDCIDCSFTENVAEAGAGMDLYYSDATLTDTTFQGNEAIGDGGGLSATSYCELTMTGGGFSENVAEDGGGAALGNHTTATLTDVGFSENVADDAAGLYVDDDSQLFASAVAFDGNTASDNGGGIYLYRDSYAEIDASSFTDNGAETGGGIYIYNATADISETAFSANAATSRGGGGMIYGDDAAVAFDGVSFTDNAADIDGGGLAVLDGDATLTDTSFSDNTAEEDGGGLFFDYDSTATAASCDFADNAPDDGFKSSSTGSSGNSYTWGSGASFACSYSTCY